VTSSPTRSNYLPGHAQARATAALGGGRVNNAKAERHLAPERSTPCSSAAATAAAGVGAGFSASCSVACAATHSEQSACTPTVRTWECVTCTTPANTTSSTHNTAIAAGNRRSLLVLGDRPIYSRLYRRRDKAPRPLQDWTQSPRLRSGFGMEKRQGKPAFALFPAFWVSVAAGYRLRLPGAVMRPT